MSRKIILIKQELLLLVYELNRSGLLAENEKIRPILAQLEKLLDRKSGSAGMPRPTLFPYTTLFRSASIKMIGVSNLQSFIASMTQKLTLSDISDESKNYLDKAGITTACLRIKSKWTAGGK